MDERLQFVRDALRDRFTMRERCARYGVSLRIGYKWLARYDAEGRRDLADRRHAPRHCPPSNRHDARRAARGRTHRTPALGRSKALEGPRHPASASKGLARSEHRGGPPGASRPGTTMRRRRPHLHPAVIRPTTIAPNDLWTAAFKGQFRTGNGEYCYPLTIADQHTRFLPSCRGLLSTQTVTARPVFERAPFASMACPSPCAPTTASPSRRRRSTTSRTSTSGGCVSASSISGFGLAVRRRTARTNGPHRVPIPSDYRPSSVTYVPGHLCYPSSRLFSVGHSRVATRRLGAVVRHASVTRERSWRRVTRSRRTPSHRPRHSFQNALSLEATSASTFTGRHLRITAWGSCGRVAKILFRTRKSGREKWWLSTTSGSASARRRTVEWLSRFGVTGCRVQVAGTTA
jgi:hypothetical protein